MEFKIEELKEIKRALNCIIAERQKMLDLELNNDIKEVNEDGLILDYSLLNKILKELDSRKEDK